MILTLPSLCLEYNLGRDEVLQRPASRPPVRPRTFQLENLVYLEATRVLADLDEYVNES